MRLRSLGALGAFAVLAVLMLAVSASGADTSTAKETYIVQMLESPVVAYEGGTAGLAATKPAKGQKIDPNSAAVKKYAAYLASQHDAALQKVGGAAKLYDYAYTYNGFAAKLTAGQKSALEKQAGVLAVSPEEMVTADTSSTPAFLGLTAPGGLWEQLGGPTAGKNGVGAGENVVIGVVDSGIWPESKSFSDRDATGKLIYQQIPGLAREVHAGRGLQRLHVQPEADRRPALQRLLGRRRGARGAPAVGVHVGARLQRSRHPHGQHLRRQQRRRRDGPRSGLRHGERYGPSGPHRLVQGAVVDRGRVHRERSDRRPRRRDRSGRGRRRRRDQLLDQRVAHQLRRSGDGLVPVRRGCGRLRRGIGREQRTDDQHGRAPEPVDDHRGRRNAQPRRPRFRHARQRRDVHRRVRGDGGRSEAVCRLDGGGSSRGGCHEGGTLLRGCGQRRYARSRPGKGRREDRRFATAASRDA